MWALPINVLSCLGLIGKVLSQPQAVLAQAEQPQENGTGFASPKGLSFMLLIGGNLGEAQIEVDHILEMH